jgi:hypothetical protein
MSEFWILDFGLKIQKWLQASEFPDFSRDLENLTSISLSYNERDCKIQNLKLNDKPLT